MKKEDWIKYEDQPLIDEDGTFLLDYYFMAIVETNRGLWIAYCTIVEGGFLEYYADTDLWESAPWRVEDITWYMEMVMPKFN